MDTLGALKACLAARQKALIALIHFSRAYEVSQGDVEVLYSTAPGCDLFSGVDGVSFMEYRNIIGRPTSLSEEESEMVGMIRSLDSEILDVMATLPCVAGFDP